MQPRQHTFFSTKLLGLASALVTVVSVASGATVPIYINTFPLEAPPAIVPQIDARAFVNRSLFDVTITNGLIPVPFETQNTLFFTNSPFPSGFMRGDPGFRFTQVANGQRLWMDTWENRGSILTDHETLFASSGISVFLDNSLASVLHVTATNVISTGNLLGSGTHGVIRLEGQKINLFHTALRTGQSTNGNQIGGLITINRTNYVNDIGIDDLYWGAGINNTIDGSGPPMQPNGQSSFPRFNLIGLSSPIHEVIENFGGFLFTNQMVIPFFPLGFAAVANTNTINRSNFVVQVVFYSTNSDIPDFSSDVKFYRLPGSPLSQVAVGWHSPQFDVTTQTTVTNEIYLTDRLPTTTNATLINNFNAPTQRPNTFTVTRFPTLPYFLGLTANSSFNPNLFTNPNLQQTDVTNKYAAYGASVTTISDSPSATIPYGLTNVPGRIDIIGGEVSFEQTRIRAETALNIKSSNLTSNHLAQVDAPDISFDARTFEPSMIISNLAPPTVRRLVGDVRAWSGVWTNVEQVVMGTNTNYNTIVFHVLIADGQLHSLVPVILHDFTARATNVVIADQLSIGEAFTIEGNGLHVPGGLDFPLGINLGATNLINVFNFTNTGIISAFGEHNFGMDRPQPYSNWVNTSIHSAGGMLIRTRNFVDSGVIDVNPGLFSLDALDGIMIGEFGSAGVFGGEVQIAANNFIVSNSFFFAGQLTLHVTNNLADAGVAAVNTWYVQQGLTLANIPTTSSLLGTYVLANPPQFGLINFISAANDLGVNPAGYTNNLALGKLTLTGVPFSTFVFFGEGVSNALYVDFLELFDEATNIAASISIPPNFTLYFADANVPPASLDGALGGRIRWVSSFVGPLSSTTLTYPSGSHYVFNAGLARSMTIDSDGDGIVNGLDATPFFVPEMTALTVSLRTGPPRAVALTWRALGYSSNFVEFRNASEPAQWRLLTNFLQGPNTGPVTVLDPMPANGDLRLYRLRLDPGPY